MELRLLYYPDPRLYAVSEPVTRDDQGLNEVIPRMFEIMYRSRGIGLAAPQAGLLRRIIVANLTGDPKQKEAEAAIVNPQIVHKAGEKLDEEGCLSLPGIYATIRRFERLTVQYRDLEGREIVRAVEGLEAKFFQHEIDHLDGVLILDKMTPADRRRWGPLLKELEKEYRSALSPRRRSPSSRPTARTR